MRVSLFELRGSSLASSAIVVAICALLVVACAPGTLDDLRLPRKVEPVVKKPPPAPVAPTPTVAVPKTGTAPASEPEVQQPQTVARLPSTEPAEPSLDAEGLLEIDPDRVRVALLLPLSGPSAPLGQAMLLAAELALFEIGNEEFDLLPFDTSGTQEGAALAAEQAVEKHVSLMLGPLLAPSAAAVAPIARRAGINVLSFSNSREVAGNGMFILGFVPSQQVESIMEYAVGRGHARFAVLVPDNPYGGAVVDALSEAAAKHAVFVTKVTKYAPGATDLSVDIKGLADFDQRRAALLAQRAELESRDDEISRKALKRLERLDTIGDVDFDAILLPEGGQALRTLASLLSFYDVDQPSVRLLGIRAWDEFHDLGTEPALVGAWFAAPPLAERAKFEKWYIETFDHRPPRLVSIAYDATALAAVLAGRAEAPDFSIATLTNKDGFLGLDGVFRLRPDGGVERVFAVIEVGRDGFRTLRPAPKSFQKLTN